MRALLFASQVLTFAFLGWRIGSLAKVVDAQQVRLAAVTQRENEDRDLIAGLESNYATNADFRRITK